MKKSPPSPHPCHPLVSPAPPVLLSEADGERWLAGEPKDLVGSDGVAVKETIVPIPLKRRKETLTQKGFVVTLVSEGAGAGAGKSSWPVSINPAVSG